MTVVKKVLSVLLLLGLLLGACVWIGYVALIPSSSEAIDVFTRYGSQSGENVPEIELADPLLVARGDVVPEVVAAVASRGMPRRDYAILFLGDAARKDALPVLRRILEDSAEDASVRGNVLISIAKIDIEEGRRRASGLANSPDLDIYARSR